MKSKHRIRMDFEKAKKAAAQLDQSASELEKLTNKDYENAMKSLSHAWTGQNENSFLMKERSIQSGIRQNASELKAIASEIRRLAKRVYDAEMRSYEIAARRH